MPEYGSPQAMSGAIGAHVSWSRTDDRAARTAPARKASMERFEREVDPEGLLEPQERAVRAEHARKAFYLKMSQASAAKRRKNSALKKLKAVDPKMAEVLAKLEKAGLSEFATPVAAEVNKTQDAAVIDAAYKAALVPEDSTEDASQSDE